MSLTVQQVYDRAKHLAGTSGVCDPKKFMERINVAGEMLIKRIDADGMMWQWQVCPCGSCVILPSGIRSVRQVWLGNEPLDIRSEWWHGRLAGGGLMGDGHTEYPWQKFVDSGRRVATQHLVGCVGKNDVFEIKSYSREDSGKEVKVAYLASNGETKTWKPKLSADVKAVFSRTGIGEVLNFEKPRTTGKVELWVKKEDGTRRLLSVYGHQEENPSYLVYEVSGHVWGTLTIKGKREWSPIRNMDDILWFGDTEVWGEALQAEAAWSNGDAQTKESRLAFAVGTLALDLRDTRPHSQGQTVQIVTPWTLNNRRSQFGHHGRPRNN